MGMMHKLWCSYPLSLSKTLTLSRFSHSPSETLDRFSLCKTPNRRFPSKTLNRHFLSETHLSDSSSHNIDKCLIQFSPFPSVSTLSLITSSEKKAILVGLSKLIKSGDVYALERFSVRFCPNSLVKIMSFFDNSHIAIAFFRFSFADFSDETVRSSCVAAKLLGQKSLHDYSIGLLDCVVARLEDIVKKGGKPSVFAFNSVLLAFSTECTCGTAYGVYNLMLKSGFTPFPSTLNSLFFALSSKGHVFSARDVLNTIIENGIPVHTVAFTLLLNSYFKEGFISCITEAQVLWDAMDKRGFSPDITAYSVYMNWLSVSGRTKAQSVLLKMVKKGLKPKNLMEKCLLDAAHVLHYTLHSWRCTRQPDVIWYEGPKNVYLTVALPDAKELSMKCEPHGLFSFSAKDAQGEQFDFSLELYGNIVPGVCKYNVELLNISFSVRKEQKGMWNRLLKTEKNTAPYIIQYDTESSREKNITMLRSMFDGVEYAGEYDGISEDERMLSCVDFSDETVQSSCVAANLLAQEGAGERAYEVYNLMVKSGRTPSPSTLNSLLLALSSEGHVFAARDVLNTIIENRIPVHMVAFTLLLNSYFKERFITEAQVLWGEMEKCGFSPDITAYSVYMNWLSVSGHVTKAQSVLLKMVEKGLKPNNLMEKCLLDAAHVLRHALRSWRCRRKPDVLWHQGPKKVYLTVAIPDVKEISMKCEPHGLFSFSAKDAHGEQFDFSLELYGNIVPGGCRYMGLRGIGFSVKKELKGWWKRLLKTEKKPAPYLIKYDESLLNSMFDGVKYAGEYDGISEDEGIDFEKIRRI